MIAEIIGWIATIFRSAGMLAKNADIVKYLVSTGNLCWMINGIMTHNIPLIASNAICLVIMLFDIIKKYVEEKWLNKVDEFVVKYGENIYNCKTKTFKFRFSAKIYAWYLKTFKHYNYAEWNYRFLPRK